MDKETHKQMDKIEFLLHEIAYELRIIDEEGKYIERDQRDEEQEETDEGIPLPPEKIRTSIKSKKTNFADEEDEEDN